MKNRIIAISVVALALLCSCKDDEKIPIDTNTYHPSSRFTFSISMGQAESMTNDILITALNFINDSSLWTRSGFPSVSTSSDTSYPRTITIDFGSADTTTLFPETADNRPRSGQMSITLSDHWRNNGSHMVITANSLKLSQMMTFDGVVEFANRGLLYYQQHLYPTFDLVINNATITKYDTSIFNYSATKIYRITKGDSTTTVKDDTFVITGTAEATQDTSAINLEIAGPYSAPHSCFWFREGQAKITEGTVRKTINFFNDRCSPMAILQYRNNDNTGESMQRYIDLP